MNEKEKYIEQLEKEIEEVKSKNKLLELEKKEIAEELKKVKEEFNKTKIKQSIKSIPDLLDENEEFDFPIGEHYYEVFIDININPNKKKNKIINEKIQLYFSLKNVLHQNNQHSFKISIINNKKIGNIDFLGSLENKKGNNIEYGTSFQIDYFFGTEQIIIIEPIINKEETENKIEYALCDLMKSPGNLVSIDIKNIGTLQINYINLKNQDNKLKSEISSFQFGITLINNEIFKTKKLHNIFYVISNYKDRKKRPVYKSIEYDFVLNKKIHTSKIKIESNILCGNKNDSIFFELYDPSLDKNNFLIGEAEFTLNQLESDFNEDKYGIIKILNKEKKIIGELEIDYNIEKKMTFEQFIKIGQINLDIAIDYTKSNKIPSDPSSLHYNNGNVENDYQKAIRSCGDIIAYYDSDELFPVYGFGGIPEGNKEVSHCFNINFSKDNDPNIHRVDNIIQFYKESLKKVKLSSPTFFSPVIRKVIEEINHDLINKKLQNHYYILMILTDGIIKDMEETKDCIVEASKLPLSIVIIGIGNADFTKMEILDGDEKPLVNSFGEKRKRDIVQFVEFNKYKDKDLDNCGPHLTEEILKEIPRQVEEYYQFCGEFYE